MRRAWLVGLLALGCSEPRRAAAEPDAVASQSIFRTISIQPFGMIKLGAPFSQREKVGAPVGPRTYRLLPSGFADTDSILVELGPDETVESIRFVYAPGKDYAAAVAEYRGSLGAPLREASGPESAGQVDRVLWQDAETQFELRRVATAGAPVQVSATLRDLVP